jgi:hypothetical protein
MFVCLVFLAINLIYSKQIAILYDQFHKHFTITTTCMFHCATSATAVTYNHKMFIKKVPDGISFSNFENISAEKYQNI